MYINKLMTCTNIHRTTKATIWRREWDSNPRRTLGSQPISSRSRYNHFGISPTNWSGWPDLNRRPLAPHASTLPDYATPRNRLCPTILKMIVDIVTFSTDIFKKRGLRSKIFFVLAIEISKPHPNSVCRYFTNLTRQLRNE